MSAQWSEEQIRMLIDERKNGNEQYHRTPNHNKRNFWEDIANEINRVNNTNYFTGKDYNKKFLALIQAYYTAKAYKEGTKKKRSLVGEQYYNEFFTEFWKESGKQRFNRANVTLPNTPSRSQLSKIPRPNVASSSANTLGFGTTSKIP
ncbi:hypothetical protein RhiirA1_515887 [Rhizophagus irregularis]|uniref:Uncharacterized protein n=1 Tax=Rhizophagus irregularis TaxID=588596 RepID=A0A2I1DYT1_9GLOM|nr:hypothetical protein RhiirA1_515887 [Rhizophagus irregularis]PKY15028.1 hypothetical protein RhiirB3_380584 [Rhizophagus irregularis]CAB4487428.1 unnamed protein product [Rhizophagus irregularis]